jgi:wyosine [tRNA(Phe)-imidazoG37] synthetase (radical SAM superfamily)
MGTFLFDRIIFGPVTSRRLGSSLGVNLLPVNRKVCNFDCIYCECGLTEKGRKGDKIPTRQEVRKELETWLENHVNDKKSIDSITFAGNGEPTMHPGFAGIVEDTLELRNRYCPGVKIAVLSNATLISRQPVFDALLKTDLNILKLDAGSEETLIRINCPMIDFSLRKTIAQMKKFDGRLIIQTLFFRGSINGIPLDNTTPDEVAKWLNVLEQIRPESIMIYTIARDTPLEDLHKISHKELKAIALKAEQKGFTVQLSA